MLPPLSSPARPGLPRGAEHARPTRDLTHTPGTLQEWRTLPPSLQRLREVVMVPLWR